MFTLMFRDDCGSEAGILQRFLQKMVAPWHENHQPCGLTSPNR